MPLIQLLVAGFNDYYNEYLGKLDKGNECWHIYNVAVLEICLFFSFIIQMGRIEKLVAHYWKALYTILEWHDETQSIFPCTEISS
jgi:hypothetical protein